MSQTPHRPGAPMPGYENLGDRNLSSEFELPPGFPQQPHQVASPSGHAANLARANQAALAAREARDKFERGRQRRPQPQEDEYQTIAELAQSRTEAPFQPMQEAPEMSLEEATALVAKAQKAGSRPHAPAPAVPQSYPQMVAPPPLSFPHFAPPGSHGPNPLMAFTRTRMPGTHIRLPSNGNYMPPGSVTLTATGELPVYPMTAADEILLKNPESLMSGVAVEQLILSCVPGITDAQSVAMPDLDVLMLAIRSASYGEKMEFEVKCPKCKADNVFDAHLPSILATTTDLPSSCQVPLTDTVTAFMRPYSLRNATQVAIVTFEETRRIQSVEEAPDDIRQQAVTIALKRINELTTLMLCDCVMHVVTPQGSVSEPAHIREFLANIPRDWTRRMETALKDLNAHGLSKKIEPTCSKCGHHWETELEFDPGSFFGRGS